MEQHTTTSRRLEQMLKILVEELVNAPDQATVSTTVGDSGRTLVFTIRTAPNDMGKVIGKRGATAIAIRSLTEAIAAKHKIRVVVEIDDCGRGNNERRRTRQ